MASFGPVPGQRPPASLLGSLQWPVLVLGLRALPLPPMSDHDLISNSLFSEHRKNCEKKKLKHLNSSHDFALKSENKRRTHARSKTVCHLKKRKAGKELIAKETL